MRFFAFPRTRLIPSASGRVVGCARGSVALAKSYVQAFGSWHGPQPFGAGVAELADAEVSQASGRKPVRVQIPPPARPRSGLTRRVSVPRLSARLARLLRRFPSQYERRWSDPSALGLSPQTFDGWNDR